MGAPLNKFQVRLAHAEHPTWTNKQIAQHLGCKDEYVRRHLAAVGKKAAPGQADRQAAHQADGAQSMMQSQVLRAVQSGIHVDARGLAANTIKTAITRLAAASIIATEVGDGSLIVDEAFVYWPTANYWRCAANISTHGYGVDKLIAAVIREAQAEAARAYVE